MEKIALVFGYGHDGNLNYQTECRCQQALQLYNGRIVRKIYLTCAIVDQNGTSLASQMACYFYEHSVSTLDCIVSPRSYNTAGEIDAFLALLQEEDDIVAVSSWYHLPRIWLLFAMRQHLVKRSASYGGARLRDILVEPIKIANALLRPFRSAKLYPQIKPS